MPVCLNREIKKDEILGSDADAVIIATGSVPKVFSLGDDNKVFTAEQVLMNKKDPGKKVAVIGGGLVGCDAARYAQQYVFS